MIAAVPPQPTIAWPKVFGLATLQGAISLCWLIYNLYLPQLLVQMGFSAELGLSLLVVENCLAIAVEPLMGSLSDRSRYFWGSRFPLIGLGILLAAALFLLLPMSVLGGHSLPWLLPGLAVTWALAMSLFRSPALSLLGEFAVQTQWPQAASLLVIMGALVGALKLTASQVILSWGPMVTFAVGSAVLVLTALVLHYLRVEQPPNSPAAGPVQTAKLHWPNLFWLLGIGVGISGGVRFMMAILQTTPVLLFSVSALFLFTVLHLLTLLPAGQQASRWGNRHAMLAGLVLLVVALPLLGGQIWLALAIPLLASGLSLVTNGTLPLALAAVPAQRAGLGTGLFFGGTALANAVLGSISTQVSGLTPPLLALCTGLCFLVTGLCVNQVKSTH